VSIIKIFKKIEHFLTWAWGSRAFWLRALLCWSIGLAFLWTDYDSHYDYRFKVRGNLYHEKDIALVLINEMDWKKLRNVQVDTFESLRSLYLNETITDNYYWDADLWTHILRKLLEHNPKKIGMTFFFGNNLGNVQVEPYQLKIFRNPKVFWPSRISPEGQIQFPKFGRHRNTGLINIYPNMDGIVRNYDTSIAGIPNFAYILSDRNRKIDEYEKKYYINYHATPEKIPTYRALDILSGKIKDSELEGKTIIVGTRDSTEHLYPTPLGFMTKSQVIAQVVDNFNHERFPKKWPIQFYALYLAIILILTLLIVFEYPQNYAMAFLISLGAVAAGLSAWIFDTYYVWTPIFATLIQIIGTYIIFIGYKLVQNERKTWRLEQEKSYLFELEQLKNNFISLISHDLKTPIAKIQGITTRLLQNSQDETLKNDLVTVQNSSQDLFRYIQSILQVTRVESSDFKLRKEAVDINQIIEKVTDQLMPLAYEKNIKVGLKLEPMFSIEIDTALIHEVIANLLENAIKYTPRGGFVEISSTESDNFVKVSVRDTGSGISKEEVDQVWEKFYRGRNHNLTTQGTGLGLFLVKYFIELHDGKVFLESNTSDEGLRGTNIGFTLPVASGNKN
jgi:two-component system, OmpR family, phosphate regulon sensor histidine kinase PhoR